MEVPGRLDVPRLAGKLTVYFAAFSNPNKKQHTWFFFGLSRAGVFGFPQQAGWLRSFSLAAEKKLFWAVLFLHRQRLSAWICGGKFEGWLVLCFVAIAVATIGYARAPRQVDSLLARARHGSAMISVRSTRDNINFEPYTIVLWRFIYENCWNTNRACNRVPNGSTHLTIHFVVYYVKEETFDSETTNANSYVYHRDGAMNFDMAGGTNVYIYIYIYVWYGNFWFEQII